MEDESCREAAERVWEYGRGEGVVRNSPAAALQEELEARTDDRRIVAELLDMPVEHWWVSTLAGSYAGGTWG